MRSTSTPNTPPQPQPTQPQPQPTPQPNNRLRGGLTPPPAQAQPGQAAATPASPQQPQPNIPNAQILKGPDGQNLVPALSQNQVSQADSNNEAAKDYFKKLEAEASAANDENANLDQAKLLTRAAQVTGPFSEPIAKLRSIIGTTLKRAGVTDPAVDEALQKAGTIEALNQIANEYNVGLQNEAHGRSLVEFSMLASKSPGAGMSVPGMMTTIAQMQGKNDYELAEQKAYNEAAQAAARQGTALDAHNFKQLWESKYTPQEFMLNRMNNEDESRKVLGQYLNSFTTDPATGQRYAQNDPRLAAGNAQIAALQAKVKDVQTRFRNDTPPPASLQLPPSLTQTPQIQPQPQPMLGNQ